MSTHPNAMLLLVMTPNDLARETARAIAGDMEPCEGVWEIKINDRTYSMRVMESDYDDDNQIAAPEGSIVLDCFLTYGYGETIGFGEVETMVADLKAWADEVCAKHHCSYAVKIGANYW